MPNLPTPHVEDGDQLVDGRQCGECTVCCTVLKIDEPDFKKFSGVTCTHCASGGGCSIYDTRPGICRVWFCGWRRYPWLSAEMWPHRSGILVRVRQANGQSPADATPGLSFQVLTSHFALYNKPVWNAIGTAIMNDIPTYLGILAPAGYEGRLVHLNDALRPAFEKADGEAIKRGLRRAYFAGRLANKQKSTFS